MRLSRLISVCSFACGIAPATALRNKVAADHLDVEEVQTRPFAEVAAPISPTLQRKPDVAASLAERMGRSRAEDAGAPVASEHLDGDSFLERLAVTTPNDSTAHSAGVFDWMQRTIIQIHVVEEAQNYFQPYAGGAGSAAVGSGFAVNVSLDRDDDPVFVTNAHVVRNAKSVMIELPAIGHVVFEAWVPLICDDFDLAIVRLKEPSIFKRALNDSNIVTIQVSDEPLHMGADVAAIGFPLGSATLKMSRGIISGTELVSLVGNSVCYSSTAPISPGSSGGPLFKYNADGTLTFVGVNFAAAASEGAQNLNYVVPAVHVLQALEEFKAHVTPVLEPEVVMPALGEGEAVAEGEQLSCACLGRFAQGSRVALIRPQRGAPDVGAWGTVVASDTEEPMLLVSWDDWTEGNNAGCDFVKCGSCEVTNDSSRWWARCDSVALGKLPADDAEAPDADAVQASIAKLAEEAEAEEQFAHSAFRIAPVDAISIEANAALYASSGGCERGTFLSRIYSSSVLLFADPPVQEHAFLEAVNGVELDRFGMGRSASMLGNLIPFESLMVTSAHSFKAPVVLRSCFEGRRVEHNVSMAWDDQYLDAVEMLTEPSYQQDKLDFEIFGGVTVMQMTVNHVIQFLKAGKSPTLGRWLVPEALEVPKLLITDVSRGTYAARVLSAGMVLDKVNGRHVATLRDFREKFKPESGDIWEMETERGVLYQVKFQATVMAQLQQAVHNPNMHFLATPALLAAGKELVPDDEPEAGSNQVVIQLPR